jgi:hypothetical protein
MNGVHGFLDDTAIWLLDTMFTLKMSQGNAYETVVHANSYQKQPFAAGCCRLLQGNSIRVMIGRTICTMISFVGACRNLQDATSTTYGQRGTSLTPHC